MSNKLLTVTLFNLDKSTLPDCLRNLFKNCELPWMILPQIKQTVAIAVDKVEPRERLMGDISEKAVISSKDVVIEKGAKIEAFAYIDGPTYIAKNAVVRHGAYIRGGVYIGEGCVVGHTTEIKDSIMLAESKAAHFAYLGNSILGHGVNLGAGTKLANLRFDQKSIRLRHDEKKIDTGLKKFGAIFGDHSQSGCNSVTNPGTIFMPHAAILPTKNKGGIISKD